jgi:hypothetical protein
VVKTRPQCDSCDRETLLFIRNSFSLSSPACSKLSPDPNTFAIL